MRLPNPQNQALLNHNKMMLQQLSKSQLLAIWERGRNQHPVDQALTILNFASPDQTRSELAELSIGQRDTRLLSLREQLFGGTLHCAGTCPDCNEPVDISFAIKEIQVHSTVSDQQGTELTWDDLQITYRPPNSRDLAAIASCTNDRSAEKVLIERCMVKIKRNGLPIEANELSEEAIRKTEQAIAECDPQAEILLDINCPECGSQWQQLFDIANFLWIEISVQAKRLLQEVHTLAKAYGWTEMDVLKLSDIRRQIYLEMVAS